MKSRVSLAGLVMSSLLFTTASYSQDSATSQALFERGVAEMQEGRFETACPVLQESYRIEAIPGTLFALADCDAGAGRIATAVARYQEYVGQVSNMAASQRGRHKSREKDAREQVARLQPQLPHLTLKLPASAPKGVKIKRNGLEVGEATLGLELPVDPGTHTISVQLSDGTESAQEITISKGEHRHYTIELPVKTVKAPPTTNSVPIAAAQPADAQSNSRTPLYIAGGVGAAGVLVGGISYFLSVEKKKTVDDNCVGSVCNPDGKSAADTGKSLANIATISFGVGIAGLATAGVLLLAQPKDQPKVGQIRVVPVVATDGSRGAVLGVVGQF